jgi:hypothetical protein
MLLAKLAISYTNIFTFFYKLKETLKVLAIGCHVKGPLPPSALGARSEWGGGVTWQVLFFCSRVAEFPRPMSHMTCIFGFFVVFAE